MPIIGDEMVSDELIGQWYTSLLESKNSRLNKGEDNHCFEILRIFDFGFMAQIYCTRCKRTFLAKRCPNDFRPWCKCYELPPNTFLNRTKERISLYKTIFRHPLLGIKMWVLSFACIESKIFSFAKHYNWSNIECDYLKGYNYDS